MQLLGMWSSVHNNYILLHACIFVYRYYNYKYIIIYPVMDPEGNPGVHTGTPLWLHLYIAPRSILMLAKWNALSSYRTKKTDAVAYPRML